MIRFQNVSFHYQNADAFGKQQKTRGVDALTLHVKKGEFVVLAGDSGCGKTTVTRLINGLVPHYYEGELSGAVTVCGLDAASSGIGDLAPHVGSVFQNPRSQFFNVDTTSELAFASENLCTPPEEIRENIRRVAREMHIEQLLDRSIFALSGGEKQKIAIARALYKDSPFIVMDEPTAALDPLAEADIYARLNEIIEDRTAVYISHRLSSCRFCDEIAVFHEGEIIQTGSHEELLSDEKGKYYELWQAQAQYYV